MRPVFLFVSLIWLIALPQPARSVTIVETERSVLAFTLIDASGLFTDDDGAGFESDALGPFLEAAVGSAGLGDITNANAEAVQDSEISISPDGELSADGGAATAVSFDVMDPGFPSRAQGIGEATFSILFDVVEESIYQIAIALSAELSELNIFSGAGPVEAEIMASASLLGLTTGLVFEREVVDLAADGVAVLDDFMRGGRLVPDTYLLELDASSFLRGFEDSAGFGGSGFGFSFLTFVPEPRTATLMALGLIATVRTRAQKS